MEGVRIQGQAKRSGAHATADCALSPAPGLADVVRRHVQLLRTPLVRAHDGEVAGERQAAAEPAQVEPVSRPSAEIRARADVRVPFCECRDAPQDWPVVGSYAGRFVFPCRVSGHSGVSPRTPAAGLVLSVRREAYVVGSGPNGMAAAITLARAGLRVTLLEAQSTPGGGTRSAALTLPGFVHDVCSAVHPLALSSPVFAGMPLREHGLEWIQPPVPVAHPLDGGRSVSAEVSIRRTAEQLGRDAAAYSRAVTPLAAKWRE